jgi:hypothetical protein
MAAAPHGGRCSGLTGQEGNRRSLGAADLLHWASMASVQLGKTLALGTGEHTVPGSGAVAGRAEGHLPG